RLLLGVIGVLPALDVAIALVNRIVTNRFGAKILPGLALRQGIPVDLRTIVVVPILLTDVDGVDAQVKSLEVRHLANTYDNLHFALLTDWADAPTENVTGDADLVAAAQAGI